jgi:hypothetical protein
MHVETRSVSFLVESQNQGRRFVSGLVSKPLGRFLIGLGLKTDGDSLWVVWPQNHSDGFSQFGLKTGGDGFSSVWASKPMVTVCEWFGLKITRTISGGLASKPAAMVSSGLASKPAVTVFSGLALKPVAMVFSSLASKLVVTVFSSLASKLVATVSPV